MVGISLDEVVTEEIGVVVVATDGFWKWSLDRVDFLYEVYHKRVYKLYKGWLILEVDQISQLK